MTFEGAVIKEQGVTFGVVVVKRDAIDDVSGRDQLVRSASAALGGIPTVLMAQDSGGRARYYGRPDIVRFMANVPLHALPWRRYRLAA